MRDMVSRLASRLRRFALADRAIAATEFALLVPFMLTLYMGSIELSTVVTVDRKVAVVSSSLGDLVAREKNGSFPLTKLNDYFVAAESTMRPYPTDNLEQVVTNVWIDSLGVPKVQWSRGHNGATTHAVNSDYPLPNEMLAIVSPGDCVVVAEAQISYTPLMGYFFKDAFTLYQEYFFLPRHEECLNNPS
jgi:Flp pilus assembly protein TadG